jgi:RNA polymerase sigma factor (sigma-70 family)
VLHLLNGTNIQQVSFIASFFYTFFKDILESFENQINIHYKKWLKFAKKLSNEDEAVDILNDLLEKLLTRYRDKVEELSRRGEVDKYVCRGIMNKALDRRRTYRMVELKIDLVDQGSDAMEVEAKMQLIESGLRSLTYGDRALIRYELANVGTIKQLAQEIGEDPEYLRQKLHRAKQRLKENIWHLEQ